ncbi:MULTISPECIES: ECF transporter S component [unclassified Oceanispirochaeta]|uniref:ECF transporter S component n=1 Tax=unclassified Oceanispirochaeta TaxID=2635722 RepID=UPI000E093182|nr:MULTISPECIES: ECF transporter S component [unclassified Oceanispirochaeta]MBF9014427.1 ECF transporter S component [Oceanispirochaeta sp. M2]NPD74981.1 ECF transporter S component [Oceanispirochaeta sp. M1]RDG29157.1 ECF transporter S component [Oceanispirochaeta sp. M1]
MENSIEKVKNKNSFSIVISIIAISILLNLALSWFNNTIIKSPIFLDSIFTILSAMILGPIAGITVGALTNAGMEFIYGFSGYYCPFAACNMLTGLIIGIMSRRRLFDKSIYLTLAVLLLTLANALMGSFIAFFVFKGYTNVQLDLIIDALVNTGMSLSTASFWSRIPTNLIDKILSVYLAFIMYYFYRKKRGEPLPSIF